MKMEQLASLLGKDATELAGTLNLQVDSDVSEEILTKELTNFTKELSITKFNEGKKQGEGMAKRLVMTDAEKVLKDTFGVDGKDFNELVENVKSLKTESGKPDDKIISERDKWKQTALEKEKEIDKLKNDFEVVRTTEKIKSQIGPRLEKFEFATNRVKELALNEFISNRKFKIDGSDIFIESSDNTFKTLSDNLIEDHFKEFGTVKPVGGKGTPPRGNQGGTNYGSTHSELLKAIEKATTPEELATIKTQLAALED